MKKVRVALLYGGRSEEHEVSLQSAASVMRYLDANRFEAIPIGIDKQGRWWSGTIPEMIQGYSILSLPADAQVILNTQINDEPNKLNGQLIPLHAQDNHSCAHFDVVFPVLHGPMGEDGTVQGLLELANLPYVSCGVLASAIAMDKDIAKRIVSQAGLPVTPYVALKQGRWLQDQNACLLQITQAFPFPVFVKPANLGSSVGIRKAKNSDELIAAVFNAFQYDTKILVEKAINAREIEVAVLENSHYGEAPLTSMPGEIVPQHEFYSYEAKYLDENGALLEVPAKLSEDEVQKIQRMAALVFEALECEGMARVDLFLEKATGQLFFNEVNTIPGFTKISMYPKLWEFTGISYTDLLSRLIDLALARHARKNRISISS